MLCQVNNCNRDAVFVPVVKVPPKYIPEEIVPAAMGIIPIGMCKRCVSQVKLDQVFSDALKKQIADANKKAQELNFSRARVDKMKVSREQLKKILGK